VFNSPSVFNYDTLFDSDCETISDSPLPDPESFSLLEEPEEAVEFSKKRKADEMLEGLTFRVMKNRCDDDHTTSIDRTTSIGNEVFNTLCKKVCT
jgi:hypothetical protein